MNTINVISPYKHHGMWVFDDPRVGLDKEPFVAGADTMIDRVVADIPDAAKGFTLIFSATPFPGHQHRLDWLREDPDGGNWYRSEALAMDGWLCPALFHYFAEAPKSIYVQTKARGCSFWIPHDDQALLIQIAPRIRRMAGYGTVQEFGCDRRFAKCLSLLKRTATVPRPAATAGTTLSDLCRPRRHIGN